MQPKNYLTIPEFAEKIGLSRSQVFRRVKAGLVKAEKAGKIHLIPIDELYKITGEVTQQDRHLIAHGVKKTLKDYGSVIKDLGDE